MPFVEKICLKNMFNVHFYVHFDLLQLSQRYSFLQKFNLKILEKSAGVYKDYCILKVYSEKGEKMLNIIPCSFSKNQYLR